MRRDEYCVDDPKTIDGILAKPAIGYLGIVTPDGYPRVVPLNFVTEDRTVFFHGAVEGEKFTVLYSRPKVTFNVNMPYSFIPSHWLTNDHAGGATMLYQSVQINGRASVINDADESARVLQLLMEKYQPEGNFRPITATEPIYQRLLKETAVFRIDPDRVECRVKLAQDKPEATRRKLITLLEERAEGMDLQTAAEIKKTLGDG